MVQDHNQEIQSKPQLRWRTRNKQKNTKNKDFIPTSSALAIIKSPHPPPTTLLREANNEDLQEPKNFKEATLNLKWVSTMVEEINALLENKIWKLTDKPQDTNVIEHRWVYRVKRNLDGTIERVKARLIAQG